MVIQEFGIWQIDKEYGIIGKVKEGYDYNIMSVRLWETREYHEYLLWDWPIHLTEKKWVTKKVFDDFVLALIFAQDYFKSDRRDNSTINGSNFQTINIGRQLIDIGNKQSKPSSSVNDEVLEYFEDLSNMNFL